MKALTVRLLLGAVLLVFILCACTDNGGSIYYILEHEEKQPESNIGKYMTIFDVAKIGTKYYAAAGAIFVGSSASGALTWLPKQKLALPASNALCNALAAFPAASPNLYGGFITPSENLGLYKATGDAFSSTGLVSGPNVTGPEFQVIRLIVANGRLLIVTAKSNNSSSSSQPFYYFLTSYDGTTFTTLLTGIEDKINDATFDGTNYWAVAGTKMYTDSPLGATFPGAPGSNNVLQGISSNAGMIYVSMKKKGLYIYDGANWTLIKPDDQSGSDVSYQGIYVFPSGTVIVGSDGYGVYYYKPGFTKLARSDDSDMITLDLYDASIKRFFVDAPIVLACTNGKGLWRGTIDPSNDSGVSGWEIQ